MASLTAEGKNVFWLKLLGIKSRTYKLTTFNDLKVGQKASLTKTITEEDLNHFIAITGDKNLLHIDEFFAEQTFFE